MNDSFTVERKRLNPIFCKNTRGMHYTKTKTNHNYPIILNGIKIRISSESKIEFDPNNSLIRGG